MARSGFRLSHGLILWMVLPLLLSCGHDRNAEPPPIARNSTLFFGKRGIQLLEGEAILPATRLDILHALGPPDRKLGPEARVLIWDRLGILAQLSGDSDTVTLLEVVCVPEPDEEFEPAGGFPGSLAFRHMHITCSTTREQLSREGLEPGVHGWQFLRAGMVSAILIMFADDQGVERMEFTLEEEIEPPEGRRPRVDETAISYVRKLEEALRDGRALDELVPEDLTGGGEVNGEDLRRVWREVAFAGRYPPEVLGHGYSGCEIAAVFAVFGKALPSETVELLLYNGSFLSDPPRECILEVLSGMMAAAADRLVTCATSDREGFADWCLIVLEYHRARATGAEWSAPTRIVNRPERVQEWVEWWQALESGTATRPESSR